MIKSWLSAAKIGIKVLILYVGLSSLCAICLDGYILLELLWKGMPTITWMGLHSIVWLFLFLLGIVGLAALGLFIGTNVAVEKVLQYLIMEYEPYIWEYLLKYIKRNHSGEITLSAIQQHLTSMKKQIDDLPWLIRKAILLFVELFPAAEMIHKKSNMLVESNFDEKKVAEILAKEKNELEEVKLANAPWLMLILGGQILLFVIYEIVR